MRKNLRFVGLDVHQDTISIAVAESGREPARLLETIPADGWLLLKVLDRLGPIPVMRYPRARISEWSTVVIELARLPGFLTMT